MGASFMDPARWWETLTAITLEFGDGLTIPPPKKSDFRDGLFSVYHITGHVEEEICNI